MKQEPGIFIRDSIRFAFGRRRSFVIEFIFNEVKNKQQKGELVNGYVHIPDELISERTGYSKKGIHNCLSYLIDKQVVKTESFGTDTNSFYKVDFNLFYKEVLPACTKSMIEFYNNKDDSKGVS